MTLRTIALGAAVIMTGAALAGTKTYTVKGGDTLSGIASKFGVTQKAILEANTLGNKHHLKLGLKLTIPTGSTAKRAGHGSVSSSASGYKVRKGDNDESIAKKFHTTAKALHAMNPEVHWHSLRPGTSLTLPGGAKSTSVAAHSAKSPKASLVAAHTGKSPKLSTVINSHAATYTVAEDDNDWIIARKVGTTPSKLREMNPSVHWDRIQPGQHIRIPGHSVPSIALAVLHTRHAVINGDNVTIRRHPSTNAERITTIDRGTAVTVLDREGSWYRLRFPKGTEGWVRGDFLKGVKTQVVAKLEHHRQSHELPRVTAHVSSALKSAVAVKAKPHAKAHAKAGRNSRVASIVATGASCDPSNLLQKAESFRGVRYRYGGMSRSGTDCSGFTSQVYRAQGIRLPRTAAEQSGRGQKVVKGQLKAGDLVFFKTNRGTRINHVGIYVGNGNFIHASSGAGHVRVSSLSDGYYQRRFATARRVGNYAGKRKGSATRVAQHDTLSVSHVEAEAPKPPASRNTDEIVH